MDVPGRRQFAPRTPAERRHHERDPCIPAVWPQYSVEWTVGRTRYRVTVLNPEQRSQGIGSAELDGVAVDARAIRYKTMAGVHEVTIVLGAGPGESSTPAAAAGLAGSDKLHRSQETQAISCGQASYTFLHCRGGCAAS
jgi:hypothetical protein